MRQNEVRKRKLGSSVDACVSAPLPDADGRPAFAGRRGALGSAACAPISVAPCLCGKSRGHDRSV